MIVCDHIKALANFYSATWWKRAIELANREKHFVLVVVQILIAIGDGNKKKIENKTEIGKKNCFSKVINRLCDKLLIEFLFSCKFFCSRVVNWIQEFFMFKTFLLKNVNICNFTFKPKNGTFSTRKKTLQL